MKWLDSTLNNNRNVLTRSSKLRMLLKKPAKLSSAASKTKKCKGEPRKNSKKTCATSSTFKKTSLQPASVNVKPKKRKPAKSANFKKQKTSRCA